jgi:hypothetical protein
VKPVVTSGPGDFTITLPAIKDFSTVYDDIGLNYTLKIYLGWGTPSATPILTGKTLKPHTQASEKGAYRIFEGKDLGEQLERTFKKNKRWQNVEADDIAAELANDLSIYDAAKIATDTTTEIQTVRTESYWSILQKVSDYWYDASTKVQKDFCVDTDGELVWKARPWRTVGVETLTLLHDYKLTQDILASKNSITVYGAANSFLPNDKDWAETTDEWSATTGTLSAVSTPLTPKAGTYYIECTNTGTSTVTNKFGRTLPKINLRDINKLNFWQATAHSSDPTPAITETIRLFAPDTSNYFQTTTYSGTPTSGTWYWASLALGENALYDADENPTGPWTIGAGDPNWWDLERIEWEFNSALPVSSHTITSNIDKLHFGPYRCYGTAEDPTNQGIYGLREAEYTDDNLLSTSECTKRAESLKMQLYDKTIALTCTVPGNTNILVGDRIPVTLPLDNITAQDMDVVAVEHNYTQNALFTTTPSFIYTGDIRVLPPSNPFDATNRQLQHLKSVTSELYTRIVR